jgi:hypothetical protein
VDLPEDLGPFTKIATVPGGEAAMASSRGGDSGAAIAVDRVGDPTVLVASRSGRGEG